MVTAGHKRPQTQTRSLPRQSPDSWGPSGSQAQPGAGLCSETLPGRGGAVRGATGTLVQTGQGHGTPARAGFWAGAGPEPTPPPFQDAQRPHWLAGLWPQLHPAGGQGGPGPSRRKDQRLHISPGDAAGAGSGVPTTAGDRAGQRPWLVAGEGRGPRGGGTAGGGSRCGRQGQDGGPERGQESLPKGTPGRGLMSGVSSAPPARAAAEGPAATARAHGSGFIGTRFCLRVSMPALAGFMPPQGSALAMLGTVWPRTPKCPPPPLAGSIGDLRLRGRRVPEASRGI